MYATIADINKRIRQDELIRLTDETDSGEVDTDKVDAAIESACLEIDSYLGRSTRYTLPLASTPPLLTSLTVDLAIWNLYSVADADGMPKTRDERRRIAVEALHEIASGTRTMGEDDPGSTAATCSTEDRLFSRDTMRGLL